MYADSLSFGTKSNVTVFALHLGLCVSPSLSTFCTEIILWLKFDTVICGGVLSKVIVSETMA